MAILVTGAGGTLGKPIVEYFAKQHSDVVAVDLDTTHLESFPDDVHVVQGDISNWSQILNIINQYNVKGVIHLAVAPLRYTNEVPQVGLETNIGGTLNVLEAGRLLDLEKIICFSSASVYGPHSDIGKNVSEEDVNLPLNGIYPVTKLAVEGFCFNYRKLYDLDITVIRPSRTYGPTRPPRKLLPVDILVREAAAGNDLKFKRGMDTPIDYTYIKDLVHAVELAYKTSHPESTVFGISQGELAEVEEIINVIGNEFPELSIDIGPGIWEGFIERQQSTSLTYKRGLRPPLDISRAREELGYEPKYDIKNGVLDYIESIEESL